MATVLRGPIYFRAHRRPDVVVGPTTNSLSTLLSPPAAGPYVPVMLGCVDPKIQIQVFIPPNLLVSTLAPGVQPLPVGAHNFLAVPWAKPLVNLTRSPNLQQSTLAPAVTPLPAGRFSLASAPRPTVFGRVTPQPNLNATTLSPGSGPLTPVVCSGGTFDALTPMPGLML